MSSRRQTTILTIFTIFGPIVGGLGWYFSITWLFWTGVILSSSDVYLDVMDRTIPFLQIIFIVTGALIADQWYIGAGLGSLIASGLGFGLKNLVYLLQRFNFAFFNRPLKSASIRTKGEMNMRKLTYEELKLRYPDYDYVLNGQINPSEISIFEKAILDSGYMRGFFSRKDGYSLEHPGGIDGILCGVASFNRAFDDLLHDTAKCTGEELNEKLYGLLTLTQLASNVNDSRKIVQMVDKFIALRTPEFQLVHLQALVWDRTLRERLDKFIKW